MKLNLKEKAKHLWQRKRKTTLEEKEKKDVHAYMEIPVWILVFAMIGKIDMKLHQEMLSQLKKSVF